MNFASLSNLSNRLLGNQSRNSRSSSSKANGESQAGQILRDVRYAWLLRRDSEFDVNSETATEAQVRLEQNMSLVPSGETLLFDPRMVTCQSDMEQGADNEPSRVAISSMYINQHTVTNAEFQSFVNAGGYENMELWPREIWPNVLQFVDQSGSAGPKFWSGGKPPKDKLDHPVVGVSWYEADAFARWVGQYLPTAAQWQHAGIWAPTASLSQSPNKYPWGNVFESSHANTWHAIVGDTVPVNEYYDGTTPNGIYQLIGNVWEWVADEFVYNLNNEGHDSGDASRLGEIRGGAFDTYFENQLTCQFRSGISRFSRENNLGFRCCIPVEQMNISLSGGSED